MEDVASDYNNSRFVHNRSEHHDYDYWDPFEHHLYGRLITYLAVIGLPIVVFCGSFTNILAVVVILRSRLWSKHEGYVYLAANFCVNVAVLLFCTSSFWITANDPNDKYYPPNTSNFVCKLWHFLMSVFFASGWLSVALLFSVYLREHLIHRRRCGCPMFAAKYCTLFASKIIVGVIFSVLCVCGVPYLAFFKIDYDDGICRSANRGLHISLLVEVILMWVLPFVLFLPIILLMTLCTKREGNAFGFSQIEERSESDEQMRVVAVTLSSMTLFSQFVLVFTHRAILFGDDFFDTVIEFAFGLTLCLQPILCFVILKELRHRFLSQLRNIRCCLCLCPSLDRDEGVVQLTSIQEDPPSTSES